MTTRLLRDVRRLAMQLLYTIDMTGEATRLMLMDAADDEANDEVIREPAVELARAAWAGHEMADHRVAKLAPAWPTHRQPPVDRAILRLAHHELATGRTPTKIAINEAIELAKRYGGEGSPAFINGVLDKLARSLRNPADEAEAAADPATREASTSEPAEADPDAWLDDAVSG